MRHSILMRGLHSNTQHQPITMVKFSHFRLFFLIGIAIAKLSCTQAQSPEHYDASRILADLKKMNVLGNALYMAAHPDDENTRLITYLRNENLWNTSYLSLTRGDGGQNLIGAEQGDLLGIIRTQELLQARRVDGGKQFFSRARDFGFSKNPEETFNIWNKEQVLADAVWAIRKLKPDVIITRFSLEPGKTHGHHTASALIAVEAFEAAADKNKFPEQLKYVDVWQPLRVVWNSSHFFYASEKELLEKKPLSLNVGGYNPLLGASYGEIAAESRSMHKSQGFGTGGNRGAQTEYFEHLKGTKAEKSILEGVNAGWSRVKGGPLVEKIIQKAIETFDPSNPALILPLLLEANTAIQRLEDAYWKEQKLEELKYIIQHCLGMFFEATTLQHTIAPGDRLKINIEAVNRSDKKVLLQSIQVFPFGKDTSLAVPLTSEVQNVSELYTIPDSVPYSQPYWLKEDGSLGMFEVKDQQEIGLPENLPPFQAVVNILIEGQPFQFKLPVVFKKTDPVEGEIYRPLAVGPPVFVTISQKVFLFSDGQPKVIQATVRAGKDNVAGMVQITLPHGWKAEVQELPFKLLARGEEQHLDFKIIPPHNSGEGTISLKARMQNREYSNGLLTIQYKHIPTQTLFPEAICKVIELDIRKKGDHIGYIMGAGDNVPASLEQVGYKITVLKDHEINLANLKKFDAVITGVRAYNTNEKMKFHQAALLRYVKEGGTLILQYNTANGLLMDSIAPYTLKLSSDRVTVENAPVRMLNAAHPLLNTPNKITDKDFDNWVQERGLYFPKEWGKEFEVILSCNDPDESPKDGGLLVAKYGKGYYIYSGYSWFRELPAGVPGAFRLFVNMISIGK